MSDATPAALQAPAELGTLAQRSARGAAITGISQILKLGLTVVSTVTLARLLTPADYGLVGMAAAFTQFVAMFKDLGLSNATIQRRELKPGHVSALFWVNVSVSTLLAVGTASLSFLISRFYQEPRLLPVVAVLSTGFVLGGLAIQHEALVRRQMNFGVLALVELTSLVAGFLVAATSAWLGAHYWALVWANLATQGVFAAGVWLTCGWVPGRPVMGREVKEMLQFGGNFTGFSVVNYFARNVDNILIGRVWGPSQLGFYDRAYQLLLLPINQINGPLTAVATPLLSRLQDDAERYRRTYVRLIEKIAMVTMPAMACLIVTSDWSVRVILGDKWIASAEVFRWLGLVGLLQPVSNTTGWLYITQGRTADMFRWGLLGGGATILSIVAGVQWGAVGVAICYAVGGILQFPAAIWYATRRGPVQKGDVFRSLGMPALSAAAVFASLTALRHFYAPESAVAGVLVFYAAGVIAALLPLLLLPSGRASLLDTFAMLLRARDRRPAA